MKNRKLIVVGAGIGGLSAALWLLQKGYKVEILEASERPGGRMVALERKGDRMDVGAQFYHSSFYVSMLMPVFHLDRPLRKDVWCYFNDPGEPRTFMFAIDALAKVPDMCPGGKRTLTAWPHHPITLGLMQQTDEEILEKAVEDVGR